MSLAGIQDDLELATRLAVRRRSTCRCWQRRLMKPSRPACSPAARPICRNRGQLFHSWLPYRRRTDAKISEASPVVLRLADQRHWSRLAFLMAVDTTGLPVRPPAPPFLDLPRAFSRPGEHRSSSRSPPVRPAARPRARAREQPPGNWRMELLCHIHCSM